MSFTPGNPELDRAYRGYMSCRLLSSSQLPALYQDEYLDQLIKYNMESKNLDAGELEYLGMSPKELIGRVLDIGIGGGRSLIQALENGIDMYGIEIGLLADWGSLHPGAPIMQAESIAKKHLKSVIAQYPDRVWQIDAAKRIPIEDDSFETTITCISLPNYSRNPREIITSILEMVRVTRGNVAFVTNYEGTPTTGQLDKFTKAGKGSYLFPLHDLLTDLSTHGIELSYRTAIFEGKKVISAHLNTTAKNQQSLTEYTPEIFARHAPERIASNN